MNNYLAAGTKEVLEIAITISAGFSQRKWMKRLV